jgi:hypothetical protein
MTKQDKPSLENPAEGVTVDPETGVQTISWEGVTPGDEPDGYVDAGFPVGQ